MNTELKPYSKEILFNVLSDIPLDIEGSNISKTGWYPNVDWDAKYMSKEEIEKATNEAIEQDSKVLFQNVYLDYETCECEYPCSHSRYVWQIIIKDVNQRFDIGIEEDSIVVYHDQKQASIPPNTTVYDFYRMCEMVGVKLEFSEYAKSLFNHHKDSSELLKQNKEMREMLDFDFVKRMKTEMEANKHKGDWKEFAIKENRPDILREIEHHYNKLVLAFESDDDELIREHSADIGNIAMFMFKSTEQFLTPKK